MRTSYRNGFITLSGNQCRMTIQEKLEILANAAKYDVSCASSGSRRENRGGGLGKSASGGICHSFHWPALFGNQGMKVLVRRW